MKVKDYCQFEDSFIYRYSMWHYRRYTRENIFDTAEYFSVFKYIEEIGFELCKRYLNNKKTRYVIRLREWNFLCRKYMKKARMTKNLTALKWIFSFWNDGRTMFKSFSKNYVLYNPNNFLRDASIHEISLAHLDKCHEYDMTNLKVLTYRNVNAIVDKYYDAHILDMYGNAVKTFTLQWDWWYLIDVYLDLDRYLDALNNEIFNSEVVYDF